MDVTFVNKFEVDGDIDSAWAVITDMHQVAQCVPGAKITEDRHDGTYAGTVGIAIGPINVSYAGELEKRAESKQDKSMVLVASATDANGFGSVTAEFTLTLEQTDGKVQGTLHSTVDITGRAAQFGRGPMEQVAKRVIKQFAANLQKKLAEQSRQASRTSEPVAVTGSSATSEQWVIRLLVATVAGLAWWGFRRRWRITFERREQRSAPDHR